MSENKEASTATFGDFEVDGVSYVIKYTTGQVKLFEASNRPLMAIFAVSGGTPTVDELETLLSYGICEEGGGYLNPKVAFDMASRLVEENGYWPMYEKVMDALGRDCNFLFAGMDRMMMRYLS